jgi:hypothetical protein
VEYRKREGFNRFAGGVSTPGFSGGALIWHYTNYHPIAVSGQILEPRLGLKLPDYGMKLKANPGSPSHFFWAKRPKLNAATSPASNSAAGRQTGISISGFTLKHGKLNFKVAYSQGGIPRWDRFFVKGEPLPEKLKGRIYAEATGASTTSLVLQGADLYLSPGSSFSTALTASDSKIHLLEDAHCTVTGKSILDRAMQISGSGTFSANPGSSLIVGPTGRVDVGKDTRMTLAPGMKLLLDPGAVVDVKGGLSAPDSIARRTKRAK